MDTNISIPFPSVFLEVIRGSADARPRIYVPKCERGGHFRATGLFPPAHRRLPELAPPPPRLLQPTPPPLPGLAPPPALGPTPSAARRDSPALAPPLRRSKGSAGARFCRHGDAASPAAGSELRTGCDRGLRSVSALRLGGVKEAPTGSDCAVPLLPRRRPRSLGPEFFMPEILGNYSGKIGDVKEPRNRQDDRLLVFDPKETAATGPNEAMSGKCLFGYRPTLASKLYSSATQASLNVAKTWSEKREVSSVNNEKKVSLKHTDNRVSSKSTGNKDTLTHLQSKLWSSPFLKEGTGTVGKDANIAKQVKNTKYCPQDTKDKLSKSTDDDGEDDTNDKDDETSNPNKVIRAPLELMTEFLRAEMDRDYHLAKKLCQMILIYEPENPEAKEFFSLIEEMLLLEKEQSPEEGNEDLEDSSAESEGDSSEEPSDESSDECEDG